MEYIVIATSCFREHSRCAARSTNRLIAQFNILNNLFFVRNVRSQPSFLYFGRRKRVSHLTGEIYYNPLYLHVRRLIERYHPRLKDVYCACELADPRSRRAITKQTWHAVEEICARYGTLYGPFMIYNSMALYALQLYKALWFKTRGGFMTPYYS